MNRPSSTSFVPAVVPAIALLCSAALAQGSASVVNGTLRIDAGPGSVQVKVTVDQRGAAQVFDVPGLPSPIDFAGVRAIDYRSGPGSDQLQFEVVTDRSFPITIANASGETILDQKYRVLPTSARVDLTTIVQSTQGNDLLQYEAVTFGQDVGVNFVALTGEGETDFFAKVDSPNRSQRLDMVFGALTGSGTDNIVLDCVSNAAIPTLQAVGFTGGGSDRFDVFMDQKVRADVLVGLFGDLGLGTDLADVRLYGSLANYLHYGDLIGGADNDELKLFVDTSLITLGNFDGDFGDDTVRMLVTRNLDGFPRLAGSEGDDVLELAVSGRRGGTPTLDGGPGFDVGSGYGRFLSVEQIN